MLTSRIYYHEERIGRLNETLELVLLLLKLGWRIQQINVVLENLKSQNTSTTITQIRYDRFNITREIQTKHENEIT